MREIGIIFVFSGILGLLFKQLKQPVLPAYVLAGALIGPLVFNLVNDPGVITNVSELAVVLMLFIIGIEMDISRLEKLGLVSILGGAIQVVATVGSGFIASKLFGFNALESMYLGIAVSFSSTMLVVKSLGEKFDLDSLYGKITIGILIAQDMFAIFALSMLSSAGDFSSKMVLTKFTTAAGLILIIVLICGKFVFPKLFDYLARDRELLFLVPMGVAFMCAFYAENEKLSLGIGSFLAGLSIARLSYQHEIIGDMKALKAFFSVLFFASLGLQLSGLPHIVDGKNVAAITTLTDGIQKNYPFVITFFVLAVLAKPLISMVVVKLFGFDRSTAFRVGISLGQISEFSLVLVAQGVSLKQLDPNLLPPVIIATVASMTVSSYLMNYDLQLYQVFNKWIWWLEKLPVSENKFDLETETKINGYDILVIGRSRLGSMIEKALRKRKANYVVVDLNPDIIARLKKEGVPCIFGDIINFEVLARINFSTIKTVFSTMKDNCDNELLISHLKKANPQANFVGIVDSRPKADNLYDIGADYVLVTYVLAGIQLLNNMDAEGTTLDSLLGDNEKVKALGNEHRHCLFGSNYELCPINEGGRGCGKCRRD